MKKILIIGSMNMDFVLQVEQMPQVGETILSKGFDLIPGGKGANQAFAAGKLGGCAAMLGAVGQDEYGTRLCDNLANVGVDVSGVKRIADAGTGTAFICVNRQGDNSIVVTQGANRLVNRALLDENRLLLEASDIVIFQLEIPVDTVVYGAALAKSLGKTVILDPAPAVADLPAALLQNVDVLKPNEIEVRILAGNPEMEIEDACKKLLQTGVKNLIVTLGAQGALLYTSDGLRREFPGDLNIQAVDTTAAGDSFTAAMALGLAKGQTLTAAIAFAVKVSGIVVTRKGAQTSIPSAEEVAKAI